MKTKVCTKCNRKKSISEFSKAKNRKDGLQIYCKKCDQDYHKKFPWKRLLYDMKRRCENPKRDDYARYGGKGIKCLIIEKELKEIWFRDEAHLMDKPSIDRKKNSGHYEYDNCKFIELSVNSNKDSKISIIQYSKKGYHIRVWGSIKEASVATGESYFLINKNCKRLKTYGNKFIWRYADVD